MTGLDPEQDKIIEVAGIVTDWEFNEVKSFEYIIQQDEACLSKMNQFVTSMHTKSGLLQKLNNNQGEDEEKIQKCIIKIIREYSPEQPIILAGNSIHQDRRFIRQYWKNIDSLLHYRMLDVSSYKVIFENKFDLNYEKQSSHRALDDIRGSIQELQYYLRFISV
jgi:oligoribonuclease